MFFFPNSLLFANRLFSNQNKTDSKIQTNLFFFDLQTRDRKRFCLLKTLFSDKNVLRTIEFLQNTTFLLKKTVFFGFVETQHKISKHELNICN